MAARCGGRSARERAPEFPGSLQPSPVLEPKSRDFLPLRCSLPGSARCPDPSMEDTAAGSRSLRRQIERRLLQFWAAIRSNPSGRGAATRTRGCIAADQGRPDLCAQSGIRSPEGWSTDLADLLTASGSRMGNQCQSWPTRPARRPAIPCPCHAMGRTCRSANSLGFSGRPGTTRAGSSPKRRAHVSAAAQRTPTHTAAFHAVRARAGHLFASITSAGQLRPASGVRTACLPDSGDRVIRPPATVCSA